jgi:beta-galactosidase
MAGHWYEGGGIFRAVRIVRTNHTYIQSTFARTIPPNLPPGRLPFWVPALNISASIINPPTAGPSAGKGVVEFSLYDETDALVGESLAPLSEGSTRGNSVEVLGFIELDAPGPTRLWSVQKPSLFRLRTTLHSSKDHVSSDNTVDELDTAIGIRDARFDTEGFHLNGKRVILRGFSDHNSFAVRLLGSAALACTRTIAVCV